MTAIISRLYNNYADARDAVRNLEAAGVAHSDINIIASNADNWYSSDRKAGKDTFPDRDLDGKDDRAEAAGAGAGVGAAVGGTAGLLAGLGLMAIPGVGPVVAAGWLVATLAGAAAGGVAGSVVGALTHAGVSKEDADIYAEGLRRGGAVVSARVPDADATRLQAIMDRSAVNVRERAGVYRQGGWQAFNAKETPYTADQVRKERELYMQR
jgi:hypothetical protein